jgi:drug/metabolite transporter (DMT)-like permease
MHWAWLSLLSALLLGCYDVCQKHALRGNPVLPVLLVSTATNAVVWGALLVGQAIAPELYPALLRVPALGLLGHAQLLFKSLLVASSWLCSYLAVKHLPISLAAPIRASSPLWTLAALSDPMGLVSLVASIRRGATLIAFGAGVLLFKEPNGLKKLGPVLGVVLGIVLTLLG